MYKLKINEDSLVVRKQDNEMEIDDFRIVIPQHIENKLVIIIHEQFGLHQGIFKGTTRLLRHFYLPVPTTVVKDVVTKCLRCNRKAKHVASTLKPHKEQVNSFRATKPLQTILIDHWGPINPKDGRFRACLTCRDSYTIFIWITPVTDLLQNKSSESKSSRFLEVQRRWLATITQHSRMNKWLHSARNGKSDLALYHHITQPLTKRSNAYTYKDIGSTIRATLSSDLKWTKVVHLIKIALNTRIRSTKQFSIYYLMFYRIPSIIRSQLEPITNDVPNEDGNVNRLADKFRREFQIVDTNIERKLEYRELT